VEGVLNSGTKGPGEAVKKTKKEGIAYEKKGHEPKMRFRHVRGGTLGERGGNSLSTGRYKAECAALKDDVNRPRDTK